MISTGDLIIQLCNWGFGTLEWVRRSLRRPKVEAISTNELRELVGQHGSSLVLIDVRSSAELAISRIPGAITQEQYEANLSSLAHKHVVVYCTVGGRSYLYARRLVTGGVDAKNYRAGILGWCRAGLPLETVDGQTTSAVHPYWRIFHVPDQYEVKT